MISIHRYLKVFKERFFLPFRKCQNRYFSIFVKHQSFIFCLLKWLVYIGIWKKCSRKDFLSFRDLFFNCTIQSIKAVIFQSVFGNWLKGCSNNFRQKWKWDNKVQFTAGYKLIYCLQNFHKIWSKTIKTKGNQGDVCQFFITKRHNFLILNVKKWI